MKKRERTERTGSEMKGNTPTRAPTGYLAKVGSRGFGVMDREQPDHVPYPTVLRFN